jgi:DNA-binding LytR/AlgR family response regulator
MTIIIIEDEQLAAERLEKMIKQYDPGIQVIFKAESVTKSVEWLQKNAHPDLAFFDIQLADGISFEIFEQIKLECPVIFTTAYDEYAIRAFKVNSIDYLLKPIDAEELVNAINKFKFTYRHKVTPQLPFGAETLDRVMKMLTNKYKNRFVVKVGEHIKFIPVEDILYFYSMEKATYLTTCDNFHYVLDHSLESLEEVVDPDKYFRINRKYLISIDAIVDMVSYSNSRLKIKLLHPPEDMIIVSRERVQEFKRWLDR